MTAPETATIPDAIRGARPGKAGKRARDGASAGAFTAELASLSNKNAAKLKRASATQPSGDPNQPASARLQQPANGVTATPLAKVSHAAAKEQKQAGKPDPENSLEPRLDMPATAAPSKPFETAPAAIGARALGAIATSRVQSPIKLPADGDIENKGASHPERNAGLDAGSKSIASSVKAGNAKAPRPDANLENAISQHRLGSQPQNTQPAHVPLQNGASAQQSVSQPFAHRSEPAPAQVTIDPTQAQTSLLLRTPEATTSSTSFSVQLDAPTITRAIEHIAWTIARRSEAGDRDFDIRMDPPELGRVDVRMSVSSDGKVSAILAVERQETLDLLARDSRTLEQALKDAGLDVGSGALSFSLRNQNASSGSDEDATGAGPAETEASVEEPVEESAQKLWLGAPSSILDIRI